MAKTSEILCIQVQDERPVIYALVDTDTETKIKTFEIFGTGHTIPETGKRQYVGTYQLRGGALVFHCFELLD